MKPKPVKEKAPKNRTITLNDAEIERYQKNLLTVKGPISSVELENKTISQDVFQVFEFLPQKFIDLVFVDPPYNLDKDFNLTSFKKMESDRYEKWLDSWVGKLVRLLKPNASVYICGDWKSSGAIFNVAQKYFKIQNRLTWQREKGRGAKKNWKNCSEDIWFCTLSNDYCFNVDSVKMKKKVLAPYKNKEGNPKDWVDEEAGRFRATHPSNIWTDSTVPFWSMPENTDHPTQKPEKLVAKVILASSKPGDMIFDPFLGSGTTSVVAKKLDRKYLGVEIDKYYSCLTEKRLELAGEDKSIQGYVGGFFWERNTIKDQKIYNTKYES